MANLILDHSNPPSPSLMYSSPGSSMSDSLEDSFMDYLQANTHDNSNDFYSVAHSDGMDSPQPPTTPLSQSCFHSDQIIVPEGDLPRVEQNDVFDLISTSSSHALPTLARKCLSFDSLTSLSSVDSTNIQSNAKSANNFSDLQIRILGIPGSGAKSRVETQIKLCIQLVTDRGDKVPLWSHLRLPEHLVAKEKYKRVNQQKSESGANVAINDTKLLTLEATVKCYSDPSRKVETCIGCIRRERRRSQRKKENKQKPTERDIPDSLPPSPTSSSGKDADDNNVSALEKCRVLLFNCSEMIDFSSGDCILPTRITCYCRHHNEKVGFCIHFTMRNHRNQVVAQGVSPAIMITDDHKSSKSKNASTLKRNRAEFENLLSQQTSDPITPACSRKTSPQRQLSGTESSSTSISAPTTPSPTNVPVSILPRSPKYAKVDSDLNMTAIKSAPFMSIPHDTLEQDRTSHPLSATNASLSAHIVPTITNDICQPPAVPSLTPSLPEYRHRLSLPTSNINLPPVAARRRRTLNTYNNMTNAPGGLLSAIQWQSTLANASGSNVPQLNRLIPAEGPLYGGVEITVLGSGFYDGLTCLFGETPALPTHCWSQNTLVCVLPPATTPGTVVVSFKEHPLVVDGQDIVLFTYYDESDRALMELALQVVGLKMTGKLEDARQIAMRIVQGDNNQGNTNTQNSSNGHSQQRNGGELEQQIIQALENVVNLETSFKLPVSLTNQQKHSLLHLAVILGFTELTQLLIQLGINVDQQDRNGMTALHFASWTGKQDIVDILLDQGYANPDLVSSHAKTAIDLAMDSKHTEVVEAIQCYQQMCNSSSEDSDNDERSDREDIDTQDRIVEWLSGSQVHHLDSDDDLIVDAIDSNIEPVKPHEPQEPLRPRQFGDLSAWMQRTFGNKHKASLIPNSYPPNFLSGNRKLTTDEETSLLATAWYLAIASMMSSSSAHYQEKSSSPFIPMDLSVPGAALSSKNVIDLGDTDPDEADCYMDSTSLDNPVHFHQDRRLYLFWFPLLL
ncbi:hypothetical protein INT43_003854, partial [Umbelopsis isabellina]